MSTAGPLTRVLRDTHVHLTCTCAKYASRSISTCTSLTADGAATANCSLGVVLEWRKLMVPPPFSGAGFASKPFVLDLYGAYRLHRLVHRFFEETIGMSASFYAGWMYLKTVDATDHALQAFWNSHQLYSYKSTVDS